MQISMKKNILLFLFTLILFSCYKEKKLVPSPAVNSNTNTTPTQKTYVYSGNMNITKYDSSFNLITTYFRPSTISKLSGISPNYTLSTTFDATALKGETNHSIPVEISSEHFSVVTPSGTGIFADGVLAGYNKLDTLYYRVLYTDLSNKNKIFLDYTGDLINSY